MAQRTSFLITATLSLILPAMVTAQIAGGSAQLGGDPSMKTNSEIARDTYFKYTPEFTDTITGQKYGAVVDLAGRLAEKGVQNRQAVNAQLAKHLGKKISPVFKDDVLDTMRKTTQEATDLKGFKAFTDKVTKVLKVIDVVSTAAKAAGYLYEGDTTGASHVVIKDMVKKSSEAAGAFGLSWLPGGQAAGAIAGEEVYIRYVAPELNAGEKNALLKEYQKKYLNKPWLPVVQMIVRNKQTGVGEVKTLDPDVFYDQKTGLFVRRSAAAQADFERSARITWKNQNRLADYWRQYENGDLTREEIDLLNDDLKNADPDALWEPDLDALKEDAAEDDGADTPYASIDEVKHQKVTASATATDPFLGKTTITFSFWNVGALVEGRGAASVTFVFKDKDGSETWTHSGTFSGGPNGSFRMDLGEDGIVHFKLHNGQTITVEGESDALTVHNPAAFARWPK